MITYTNPLPFALRHYAIELEQTLARVGTSSNQILVPAVEGLPSVGGKIRMVTRAWGNAWGTRAHASASNIQIWPSLGLAEMLLWRQSRGHRHYVILHDPVPLRRQVGFDYLSRWVASRATGKTMPVVIVHSASAEIEARRALPNFDVVRLPHPIVSAHLVSPDPVEPVVIVAGQYKPERDLRLLRGLGPLFGAAGIRGRIQGRGWPEVPGWEVIDEFIPEDQLDALLLSASAVLLPYRNYFQSGIALRALELGALFVSTRTSFAEDVLGSSSRLIYDEPTPQAAFTAIEAAIGRRSEASQIFQRYIRLVDRHWARAPWVVPEASRPQSD